jgi:hypothetical protein
MIGDTINAALRSLNSVQSLQIWLSLIAFFIGYMTGGIFTAPTWSGRIIRGFIAFVFASAGLYDDIQRREGVILLFFVIGFAFNMRGYINGAFNWIVDLIRAFIEIVYRTFDALLKAIFYFARSLHSIIFFFTRLRMPFADAKRRADEADAVKASASQGSGSRPDIEAERRRREEEARSFRSEQERQEKSRRSDTRESKPESESEREEPRQEDPRPPPVKEPPDPTKDVDAAIRFYGLDKHLFTYEDLRQAHKKKVLALHPDKLQSFPEHIRQQLDDELKTINAARDLIKKMKGWK